MSITKKQREEIECSVCEFMDILDPTKSNSEFYQEQFAKMSDAQFDKWIKRKYPLQFQVRAWEIEPTFKEYYKAADYLGIKLLDKVALPYYYENEDGVPVNTQECLIIAINIKKMQQFITKKNKAPLEIDARSISGRLMTEDKGAATSDKEQECLATIGAVNTMKELATIKADALNSKSQAYNAILNKGVLNKEDYSLDEADSMSRNLISNYMLASHLYTNLVCKDGYTPYTLKEKSMKTVREL